MTEFVGEPPPIVDLRELLEQSSSSIFAQLPELQNEELWEGGGADPSTTWRQLLQTQRSPAQTTLLVSRDLTFREAPLEGSTVGGELGLPAPPADFCRVDCAAPAAGDGRTQEPAEWLTVAPGLSGGLDLPPPVGPAGDPGPAAAEADLLMPLMLGETRPGESPGDRTSTPPPTADDQTVDQLLQVVEPYWPVLDTSGAAPDPRPAAAASWARRADPDLTLPEGLPDKDVMTFNFELDPFQKLAVGLMEQGENVLVVAHTSAGKTAIAEYAIARALKDNQRVIYTSPVKALSNQKYGELRAQFSDVGLLTGDTQLRPEAPCLICTTEILRSMLYNRPWLTKGLRFVVLDEVHYMGDRERGHIWEECLILLPPHVNLVMLSATVPNAMDIAAWVGGIKRRLVYVVSCDRRPVPLEHRLYTGPADDLWDSRLQPRRTFSVLDQNGIFSEESFQLAFDVVHGRRLDRRRSVADLTPDAAAAAAAAGHHQAPRRRRGSESQYERQPSRPERQQSFPGHPQNRQRHRSRPDRQHSRGGGGGGGGGGGCGHAPLARRRSGAGFPTKEHWTDLVGHLKSEGLLPAIVFVFSRKRCDATAAALRDVDLTTAGEKQRIRRQLRELETHLSVTDRALATVREMEDCLLRGLGVHHAGMLPFLKETVECLFQAGLVKFLFATETFAIGINMPTRTVVFASMLKPDGRTEIRPLLPAEYIQMSGRAGRRGKDDSGTVIIMAVPQCPEKAALQTVISATPEPIRSHFRLTFFMLLNMLSVGRDAAEVVWNSFALWNRLSPGLVRQRLQRLKEKEEVAARLSAEEAELLYSLCEELVELTRQDRKERPGRLAVNGNPRAGQVLLVSSDTISRRLAVVIRVEADPWCRTQHTVLVLREPPDHGLSPEPPDHERGLESADHERSPEPPDHNPSPESAGGDGPSSECAAGEGASPAAAADEAAARDRELAGRTAAALRPALLRPTAAAAAAAARTVAPHQLLTVRWADVEAVLDKDVPAPPAVADDIRQREAPHRADWPPSPACAAAVRGLAALSDDFPAGYEGFQPPPEPPRLLELRRLLQERYPAGGRAELERTLEVVFEVGRLYRELRQLTHWDEETTAMVLVLRQLGFVDMTGHVTVKGRAACGVGYRQLLVTQLVCEGALSDLAPVELAALLSTVSHAVPVSAPQQDPDTRRLPATLARGVQRLLKVARRIDSAQKEAGLVTRTEEENSLLFDLIPAVLGWARGDELSQLEKSDQGNVCRSLQRLDETLRDVRDLAVTLCFPRLQGCVREALVAIRRGLPFSPSIYTIGPQR